MIRSKRKIENNGKALVIKVTFNYLLEMFSNFSEGRYLKQLPALSTFTSVQTSENMGRGVYALEPIPAGTLLGIYPGNYVSHRTFLDKEEFISRSVKSAYMHSENTIIDPTDIFGFLPDVPDSRIAMINEPPVGMKFNVAAVSTKKCVWYLTIEEIGVGEQLFTSYGNQYQRNYAIPNSSEFKLSESQIDCLKKVALKHTWIKRAILDYLSC